MKVRASRIPARFGAQAVALYLWVLVVPERAGDAALLAHERVHQREQLLSQAAYACALAVLLASLQVSPWWWLAQLLPVWWLAYAVPAFRLRAEVRAYRVQLALQPHRLEAFAGALATIYRLDITREQATRLLLDLPNPERAT